MQKKQDYFDLEKCVADFLGEKIKSQLCVAISGGADSTALLFALCNICEKKPIAITINHNIREKNESLLDAEFCVSICKTLGVECHTITFEREKVQNLAKERGGGLEEAARFLRYKAFCDFLGFDVRKKNQNKGRADFLCIAHNANDNLETILARFLRGSQGIYGIEAQIGRILRPLLSVPRFEIENYLKSKKISWQNDSTNSENSYFRNRIRNVLIPFLNLNFQGWERGILSSAEKSKIDEDFFVKTAKNAIEKKEKISEESVLRRIFYEKFANSGGIESVPYSVFKTLLKCGRAEFFGFDFFLKDCEIFCKKNENRNVESGFFVLIESENAKNFKNPSKLNENFSFFYDERCFVIFGENFCHKIEISPPFCVRNLFFGDEIILSGKLRMVLKILKNKKIAEKNRKSVAILEKINFEKNEIRAIFFGSDLCVSTSLEK